MASSIPMQSESSHRLTYKRNTWTTHCHHSKVQFPALSFFYFFFFLPGLKEGQGLAPARRPRAWQKRESSRQRFCRPGNKGGQTGGESEQNLMRDMKNGSSIDQTRVWSHQLTYHIIVTLWTECPPNQSKNRWADPLIRWAQQFPFWGSIFVICEAG